MQQNPIERRPQAPKIPKRIKAVVFDLDGTLVDSLPDLADSANAMRASFNLEPLDEAAMAPFMGDGMAMFARRALAADGSDKRLGEKGVETALETFKEEYAKRLVARTVAFPGTESLLNCLVRRSYTLAVASNKNERFAIEVLKGTGLLDYFKLVLGGDSCANKKPAPDPIEAVEKEFNLKAEEIMLVGDSRNDTLCANNAGCFAAHVGHGYETARSILLKTGAQADLEAQDFAQLQAMFEASDGPDSDPDPRG